MLDCGYRIIYFPDVVIRHALSQKERVPAQRFLMSNLHRMQNNVTYNPFIVRVILDLIWKVLFFVVGSIRRGYFFSIPFGIFLHFKEFFKSLFVYRRPIKKETQRLIDILANQQITSLADYKSIDKETGHFFTSLLNRFGIRR